jgi:hypothetical protein
LLTNKTLFSEKPKSTPIKNKIENSKKREKKNSRKSGFFQSILPVPLKTTPIFLKKIKK